MKLSPQQRSALKSLVRKHPDYQAAKAANGDVSLWPVQLLVGFAKQWGLAIPNDAPQGAAETFASEPLDNELDKETTTMSAAPSTSAVETLVKSVLAPMGQGDLAAFNAELRSLASKALTPREVVKEVERVVEKPVEVIKEVIVEKVVERIVEVDAPPAGCRPTHIPKVTGHSTLEGVKLDQYDAPDAPTVDAHYQWPAGTKAGLSKIARGQVVFLTGPAGTGKTTWAEQVAAHTARPFMRISCHQDTSASALLGGYVSDGQGGFRWNDGILLKAIRRPGTVVLIDEPSAARPDAMMILQGILEPNGSVTVDETGERVRVAPGVSFVLADNTNGTGDVTGAYEGTRRMNRATLDRCAATLVIDYLPPNVEASVITARTGLAPQHAAKLVAYANLTRQEVSKGSLTHAVGLRRLLAWAECIVDGIPAKEGWTVSILNTAAHDDRTKLDQLYLVAFKQS